MSSPMQEMPTEPEAGSSLVTPRVFAGRYETERVLGRGQMGEVLLVRDRRTGARLALKRVPPELVRDASVFHGVRANFALVRGLDHPHIAAARALETDPATGEACLLLDYVAGVDLAAWLIRRRGRLGDPAAPLPVSEALGIGEQIASALDFAHARPADGRTRGVLHRDLKPANVMVEDAREFRPGVPWVKLVDFGLAAEIQASMLSLSAHLPTHRAAGTPAYMAPEQWEGRTLTRGVDQWALAVMIYEMTAGRRPFSAHDVSVLREQVLRVTPEAPRALAGDAWRALRRGLALDRRARHRSCLSLVHAIADADPVTLGTIGIPRLPMPEEFPDVESSPVSEPPVAPPAPAESRAVAGLGAAPPTPVERGGDAGAPVASALMKRPSRLIPRSTIGLLLAIVVSGLLFYLRESTRLDPPANGDDPRHDPAPANRDPGEALPDNEVAPSAPKKITRETMELLRTIPGVRAVHPIYNLFVQVRVDAMLYAGELYGLPPEGGMDFLREAVVAGRMFAEGTHEVLVSREMSKNMGLEDPGMALGKTVRVTAAASRGRRPWKLSAESWEDPLDLEIVGVFDSDQHKRSSARLYPSLIEADRVRAASFEALGENPAGLAEVPGLSVRVTGFPLLDPVKTEIEKLGYRTTTLPDVLEGDENVFLVVGAVPDGSDGEEGSVETVADPVGEEEVVLLTGATSRIIEVLASEGDPLEAEAILVRCERFPMAADPLAGQARIARATAERDRCEGDWERIEPLAAQGLATSEQVEAARAALAAAKRELGFATVTLDTAEHMKFAAEVKMPFDGVVVRVHLQAGEMVPADQPLVTVRRAGAGGGR